MAIQVEIWQNHIEGNLFKNNEFLKRTTDASQYVMAGKVVHIPQAGATPGISKNRSSLPAAVSQRTDTDVTYQLDQYTSDPILIAAAEVIESSYDKRSSVLMEHENALNQHLADNLLITFSPSSAGRILRTTGEDVATHLDSTAGTRKRLTVRDIKRAQLAMNKQNIPMADRICVMSADMYDQVMDELTVTQYRDFSTYADAKNGILGRLYGFDLYQRSAVVNYSNAATPVVNAYGAAANADDNDAALFWHMDKVERAIGAIIFRERLNDPTYYGDVYSLEVRMGGRKRRTNEEGLIAVVQAAGGAA